MRNSNKKLIQILQSFSANEIGEFRKFISSPFFTKGRNYRPFLDESLRKISNTKNNHEKKTYREFKNLNDQTIRNRYWELYKLAEDFIIYKDLSKNTVERNKILLRNLTEKKIYSSFNLRLKETMKILENEKFTIEKYQDKAFFSNLNMIYLNDINESDFYYNEFNENSKNVFCLNLISFFSMEMDFFANETNLKKFEYDLIRDFIKNLKINELMESFFGSDSIIERVTSMYYFLYKAYNEPFKEIYFFKSHKLLTDLNIFLNDKLKLTIYHHLINYCMIKRNEGILRFNDELFKLYNEKLEQGLISEFKIINYQFNHFRNYVYIGLSKKEYRWVENFIEKYSKELPAEIRDEETRLSLAKLNFAKGKFEESLIFINSIKKTNYVNYTTAAILKLSAYYELEKYEEAFLELDKLNHYHRNHDDIPAILKTYIVNFIKFYQRILKLKTNPQKTNSIKLKDEIESCDKVSKKEWLLEKAIELDLV